MTTRRTFLLAGTAVAVSGCGTIDFGGVLKGVNSVPAARVALIQYLTAEELESVGSELAFLDNLLSRALDVIAGDSDITLTDLADQILGAPEKAVLLENSYVSIRAVVQSHFEATGEPVPQALLDFDEAAPPLYVAIKKAILARENVRTALDLLKLLKYIAVVV